MAYRLSTSSYSRLCGGGSGDWRVVPAHTAPLITRIGIAKPIDLDLGDEAGEAYRGAEISAFKGPGRNEIARH
jgi:hypothetical protein